MDQVTLAKTHFRKEQWKRLILECQSSGMRVEDWCVQNNVTRHAYYYWLRKLREEACDSLPIPTDLPEKPVSFKKLEVMSSLPDTRAAVIIRLPQATLEIHEGASQQTVQAVLLALPGLSAGWSLLISQL